MPLRLPAPPFNSDVQAWEGWAAELTRILEFEFDQNDFAGTRNISLRLDASTGGHLSLTGHQATLVFNKKEPGTLVPGKGTLGLTGHSATFASFVNITLTAQKGVLEVTGNQVTVNTSSTTTSQNVTAGKGTLALTGSPATVSTTPGQSVHLVPFLPGRLTIQGHKAHFINNVLTDEGGTQLTDEAGNPLQF